MITHYGKKPWEEEAYGNLFMQAIIVWTIGAILAVIILGGIIFTMLLILSKLL